jgi:hypothetical protein
MKYCCQFLGFILLLYACSSPKQEGLKWYKGDLHARCVPPGGDVGREAVTAWAHNFGYDFLVMDTACAGPSAAAGKIFLSGNKCRDEQNVTTTAINLSEQIWTALDIREEVRKGNVSPNILTYIPSTKEGLIEHHVRNINRMGGIAILALNTINKLEQGVTAGIEGLKFIEIFDGRTMDESIWDSLLTRGEKVYGSASDTSFAGKGWVMLQTDSLSVESLTDALHAGRFYASGGIILSEIHDQMNTLFVKIDTAATCRQLSMINSGISVSDTTKYKITFISLGGKVVKCENALRSHYTLKPGELYVRARISYDSATDSLSFPIAWTQAVFGDFIAMDE